MNVIEYADSDMLAIDLANRLAGDLEGSLLTHETATLAVPGGTTPGPIFDSLCAADLDWAAVQIILTDERWVPEHDAQSNAALIRQRLLTSRAAAANFTPYYTDAQSLEETAERLSDALVHLRPISVLLLGMGADMHTASLFPQTPELEMALAEEAPMFVPIRSQVSPRISICAAALEGALAKHLVITGDAKREALEAARSMDPQDAPIAAVLTDLSVHWAPS